MGLLEKTKLLAEAQQLKERVANHLNRLVGKPYFAPLSPWQSGVCLAWQQDPDSEINLVRPSGCRGKASLEAVCEEARVQCCANPACRQAAMRSAEQASR